MEQDKVPSAKGKAASKILGMEKQEPAFYVRDKEAAKLLGIARQTLVNLRHQGRGPRYAKATNRAVCYSVADLLAYMRARVIGTQDQPKDRE